MLGRRLIFKIFLFFNKLLQSHILPGIQLHIINPRSQAGNIYGWGNGVNIQLQNLTARHCVNVNLVYGLVLGVELQGVFCGVWVEGYCGGERVFCNIQNSLKRSCHFCGFQHNKMFHFLPFNVFCHYRHSFGVGIFKIT